MGYLVVTVGRGPSHPTCMYLVTDLYRAARPKGVSPAETNMKLGQKLNTIPELVTNSVGSLQFKVWIDISGDKLI
jgi:hypothetical protein